ncbi:MAG: glycosyltransferase [Bacteroidetes bacterium]|nr:glycosyltransferase [Bacteroidota bacterium]MBU1720515.1 glycosyltransferase [Bacteroidota bacterium]
MNKEQPVLSIGIATCNHKDFIRVCVNSVFEQKTEYHFHVIIHDDASDDGTSDIVDEYVAKYPEIIQLIRPEERVGPNQTAMNIFRACKGKYVTWLDGDDYWTFPEKLDRQIRFLEENPDYAGCFHDAEIVCTSGDSENSQQIVRQSYKWYNQYSQFNHYRPEFFPWDLLQRNIIPTASLVFRYKNLESFFMDFSTFGLSISWALQLILIQDSKFCYFNEVWSVYRDHPQGLSKKVDENPFKHTNIAMLKIIRRNRYYGKLKIHIHKTIANEYRQILHNPKVQSLSFFRKAATLRKFLWHQMLNSLFETFYLMKKH